MEVAHAYFSEVTRMIFIEVNSMTKQTTSIAMSTGMFPVFINTTVACTHVASQLPALLFCPHIKCNDDNNPPSEHHRLSPTKLSSDVEDETLEDTACTLRYKSVFDNTPDMWRPSSNL